MKRLFHLIPAEEFAQMKHAGLTWADVRRKYRQPAWCAYPDALGGMFGCWSLVGRKVTGEAYCSDCELYRKRS